MGLELANVEKSEPEIPNRGGVDKTLSYIQDFYNPPPTQFPKIFSWCIF
jgi:hypothetical protein